jgi:hypothetical protein
MKVILILIVISFSNNLKGAILDTSKEIQELDVDSTRMNLITEADSLILDNVMVLSKSKKLIKLGNIKVVFKINDCKVDSIKSQFGSDFKRKIIEPILKKAIRYSVVEIENPTKEMILHYIIRQRSLISDLDNAFIIFLGLEFDLL